MKSFTKLVALIAGVLNLLASAGMIRDDMLATDIQIIILLVVLNAGVAFMLYGLTIFAKDA